MAVDPDHALRLAAHAAVRRLQQAYDDVVPRNALAAGFEFEGARVSFGSFQKGIHRARSQRGRAALTLFTSVNSPYDDEFDESSRSIVYAYRAGSFDQADNRALEAAYAMQAPLIYFRGIDVAQFAVIEPVFVTELDRSQRKVLLQPGTPADLGEGGLVSPEPVRAVALREVQVRLRQHRFRRDVLRAYRHRCTICSLTRRELVQAAHITEHRLGEAVAEVRNGLALCAIHHLAYDRNLLGIDPDGVVHISRPLLEEIDGPMLREGLQGFHGAAIIPPARSDQQPDRERLSERFARFVAAA